MLHSSECYLCKYLLVELALMRLISLNRAMPGTSLKHIHEGT
ncbi:hypothetical protein SPSIL_005580 [Sporomusa silvacetica DSM 10669]|uniref:Uncharacterized protein n=1 Tax=Sporomusa silvacetica DSM 10669 TaxID=1123289 RepID=A0ABZ3IFL6_9FIRM|nr:hypothetical protein SPSIL_34820 [Sporomusa silvacetica DSM 10669]